MKTQSDVVTTFMQLVQVDSVTFHEAEICEEVSKRLESIGLDPEIDKEGNVIVKVHGDPSLETLLINAHLDTVEPGRGIKPYIDDDGWIRSEGETILGADNKSAVAAILTTVEKLINENIKHNPLEIVFTVSEESGNHGAHGLDYSKIKAKRGYIFDASDRNFGDMIISSPFYNRFDIVIKGKAAHASRPEDAINVIHTLSHALSNLKLGRVNENTIANIGLVSIGDAVNTIPGKAMIMGEVRSELEKNLDEYTNLIIQKFVRAGLECGAEVQTDVIRENIGYKFSPNDEFITKTLNILAEAGIKNSQLINSWGCYEANIFAEHGIMMLNISDGSVDTHTINERIRSVDLQKLADLIYSLVTINPQ